MDPIQEEKLMLRRRVENMIKDIEENEVKADAAIQAISAAKPTSIGPANDILRFLYLLEQQYQDDSNEIRTQTTETFLKYMNQFRSSDIEDEEEDDDDDQQPNEPQQLILVPASNRQPILIAPQQQVVGPPPPPPPPAPAVSTSSQQPIVVTTLPPPPPAPAGPPSPATSPSTLEYIKPETLANYQILSAEAQQYEKRYKTVDALRKNQLAAPLKAIMNKLREDSFTILTRDLVGFLNGQEQKVAGQSIRISNEEERLLCLSMLASLIFNQLLGSDLSDVQTRILLPLVGLLSGNQQHKEFRIIFLDRLHKKCPYTVPYYPQREPTMSDKQYLEALGYIEKKEDGQTRLETENEFFNRMSGLIRFFCKLLVQRGPPFDNQLNYAWRWMSDVANLPPRPNITAVLFRIFLDEAGESMAKEYSTQFPKANRAIRDQYLPRLAGNTTDDQITRLRLTLDALSNKFH